MKLFNMIGTLFENVGYWLLTHGPFAFKVDGAVAAATGQRVADHAGVAEDYPQGSIFDDLDDDNTHSNIMYDWDLSNYWHSMPD